VIEFFKDLGGFIMTPLYFLISAVLLGWHKVFGDIFGPASGAAWALSIIGLTLVIRAALIPLFVKQIKSQRNLQLLQPKVKELQKKYGHDRELLGKETMKLYKDTGTNPFSSCLPLIVQMPIFIGLFRLLDLASKKGEGRGLLTDDQAQQLADATLFGAPISATFKDAGGDLNVMILAGFLVLAMTLTMFLTQRQLMKKGMPPSALEGPMAQQQKIMIIVLPLVFGISGVIFPIGVLIYWTTSNLWTMGQQFYVIRNNPAPNTEAFRAKERRDEEKRKRKGLPPLDASGNVIDTSTPPEPPKPASRQQPKKQTRSQRKKTGPKPTPQQNSQPPTKNKPNSKPPNSKPTNKKKKPTNPDDSPSSKGEGT
jgi:YidC/Oxa1 family membrane protein insertase